MQRRAYQHLESFGAGGSVVSRKRIVKHMKLSGDGIFKTNRSIRV
jgi:hypothetical protein